jgi:hypothetical protein
LNLEARQAQRASKCRFTALQMRERVGDDQGAAVPVAPWEAVQVVRTAPGEPQRYLLLPGAGDVDMAYLSS